MGKEHESVSVLIVEDEPLVRMVAIEAIRAAGFRAYEAANADEAIRILERQYDIRFVFTDINMPGSMDGIRLAHCVRDRWPPIQFIITSGQMKFGEVELPNGSVFVSKPYLPEEIVRKIQKLSEANA
jgi:CheY-like chemotaxis protein